jgi:hypothetical protein
VAAWIARSGVRDEMERIRHRDLGRPELSSLEWRVMQPTTSRRRRPTGTYPSVKLYPMDDGGRRELPCFAQTV